MQVDDNVVLITGGSTGIGSALAEAFLNAGSQVLICGRREEALRAAKERLPALHTFVCDVSKTQDRKALFAWATAQFPQINVLFNNAGIQRETDFLSGAPQLTDGERELKQT